MKIFPAIDLFGGKAVRLFKGNYDEMTVYSDNPVEIAEDFKSKGAKYLHTVDLEGALKGNTPNFKTVEKLFSVGLFTEVGGGIRNAETVEKYISAGAGRVILGTSAVTDRKFLISSVEKYGEKIAVGVDIKDGFVAIKGWTEKSPLNAVDFLTELKAIGVKTVICTDISKDGALKGTNHELYRHLMEKVDINIIASGGVKDLSDIIKLKEQKTYGAIIGKAYYEKKIDLREAIGIANDN